MDAVFKFINGEPICRWCDQAMVEHKYIPGEGNMEGWDRYVCFPYGLNLPTIPIADRINEIMNG
jgi:hypothetical protein